LTQAWNIGYIGEAGPSSLNGYASNFRLVTGTAVYTSNFVPQTTPLTAISGTQILTLQNATLVDNSTNAQTVTNTGGVTVGGNYPFAIIGGTVKDFGPAGNNWTANNIGLINGSTLDTMTDVPTLTSATASNTCTWNPAQPSSILGSATYTKITNGNLNVQLVDGSSTDLVVPATFSVTTGTYYFEFTLSATASSTAYHSIGVFNGSQFNNQTIYTNSALYVWEQGKVRVNGTFVATGLATAVAGDVVGVALNATSGAISFYKNGTLLYTASSLGYTIYTPVINGDGGAGRSFNSATNFGQQPFVYTAPTGFVALNTYNL